MGVAENTAAKLGANEISNSWGSNDQSKDPSLDAEFFTHPGIAITVATGDSGFYTYYPASSPNVTAVGGTSLSRADNTRGWSETAWSGAGSGCTPYEPQPAWQAANPTISSVCANRATADVAAVADPSTGISYYDTSKPTGWNPGWGVVGGTSLASPIIAAVYALAGNAASTIAGSYPYIHTTTHNKANLNDVTAGTNGKCGGSALCTAQAGWDGPTGLGTPNGTGAF